MDWSAAKRYGYYDCNLLHSLQVNSRGWAEISFSRVICEHFMVPQTTFTFNFLYLYIITCACASFQMKMTWRCLGKNATKLWTAAQGFHFSSCKHETTGYFQQDIRTLPDWHVATKPGIQSTKYNLTEWVLCLNVTRPLAQCCQESFSMSVACRNILYSGDSVRSGESYQLRSRWFWPAEKKVFIFLQLLQSLAVYEIL